MNNPEHHTFLYNKRYNTSVGEIIEKHNTLFKIKLLHFLSKNRFTAKRLHVFDKYSIQKTKGRFAFDRKIKMSNDNSEAYRNITLSKIDYFEALEIDDFDKYINKIVSTFSNDDRMFSSTTDKDDMKEKLSEVKKNLDTISWGKLFYINFDKRREKNNDLLATVDVSYIKTNESFFIIRIQVSPSEKFKEIFAKIINSEDVTLSKQHYHTYYNILKLKRFHAHETMSSSSKCLNIENLLSDLNQQVKGKITKHFVGYFHNSKIDTILPSLEYYEVEDFTKFHNDNSLKDNFNTGFDGYYSIVDNQIEVYFSKIGKDPQKYK